MDCCLDELGTCLFRVLLSSAGHRIGSDELSLTQLKIIQEVLSLLTFVGVAFFLYKERPTMNHAISFLFIIGAAYFAVKK